MELIFGISSLGQRIGFHQLKVLARTVYSSRVNIIELSVPEISVIAIGSNPEIFVGDAANPITVGRICPGVCTKPFETAS